MKKKISSPHVPDPPPQTWSNCLVVGNQVFIAGMVASGPSGLVGGNSMYAQAQAMSVEGSSVSSCGERPVKISWRMRPKENMSLAVVMRSPRACSGLM